MPSFIPELSRWRQAVWLFLLILLSFGWQLGELDGLVRDGAAWAFRPAVGVVQQIQAQAERVHTMSILLREGSRRLAQTEYALAHTKVESDRLALLERENALLRQALGQQPEGQASQVLQFYGRGEVWFVNGGTANGVSAGQVVTWEGSLVGVIEEPYRRHSRVRTLLDESWQIPVEVGTSSAKALLSRSRGYPEILFLPNQSPVQDGDTVSTAGDAQLPPHLPIGRVHNLTDHTDGATKTAQVELYVSPSQLQLVEMEER